MITSLDAAAHDLVDCQTVDVQIIQRFLDILEFFFSDICFNFNHHFIFTFRRYTVLRHIRLLIQTVEAWISALSVL